MRRAISVPVQDVGEHGRSFASGKVNDHLVKLRISASRIVGHATLAFSGFL